MKKIAARVLTLALLITPALIAQAQAPQQPAQPQGPSQAKPAQPAQPAAPRPPARPANNQEVLEYGNVVNNAALKGDSVMLAAARLNLKEMIPSAEGPNDLRLLYYTAAYASWEFSLQAGD